MNFSTVLSEEYSFLFAEIFQVSLWKKIIRIFFKDLCDEFYHTMLISGRVRLTSFDFISHWKQGYMIIGELIPNYLHRLN